MMFPHIRAQRTPLCVASLFFLAALLAFPASMQARWDAAFGDEGRTFRDRTAGVTPPISVRGAYVVEEEFPSSIPIVLVTNDRLVLVSPMRIIAYDRAEAKAGDEAFEESEILWAYEPEQPEGAEEGDLFGPARVLNPTSVAVIGSELYFTELEGDLFTQEVGFLAGISIENGEETWRHDIGEVDRLTIARSGQWLLARYKDPDVLTGPFWDDPPDRLFRIAPGDEEPRALAEIPETLFSSSFSDLAVDAGRVYYVGEFGIAAHNPMTLEHLWTWPEDGSRENADAYDNVWSFIADGGNVYIVQRDEYRITSLDRNGNLRWIRELKEPDTNCNERLFVSLHPDMLIVTGICNRVDMVDGSFESLGSFQGLNPATGETVWNVPAEHFQGPVHPVVSGGLFFKDQLLLGQVDGRYVRAFDVYTGEVVDAWSSGMTARMYGPAAASDGYLFAISLGLFGAGMGDVLAFETEPADLGVEFAEPDELFPCDVPVGTPVTVPVRYSNNGPGLAPNAELELWDALGPGYFEWIAPEDGYAAEISGDGRTMIVQLGDVPAGTSGEFEVTVVPLINADALLRARARSDVRLTDSDRSQDGLTVRVTAEPAPGLDLSVAWVEVTQGLQDRDNSIGLIAGRPTLVRAYVESNVPVTSVQAEMRLTYQETLDMSSWFFDRPVQPFENCITVTSTSASRDDFGTTFNFLLPPDLMDPRDMGPFQMEIVVDPENHLREANRENNVYTRELAFEAMAPICLVTHSVRSLAMGGGDTYGPHRIPQDHLDRATAMLPTPHVMQVSSGNTLEKVVSSGGILPPTEWGPYELDPGGSTNLVRLLGTLFAHSLTTSDPEACRALGFSVHHVGVVAEDNLSTRPNSNFNGYAWMVEGVFTFRVRSGGGSSFNEPAGGTTLAHELGHTFRRFHVDCGSPAGALSNFPHPDCQLGPLGHAAFHGVDLVDPLDPVLIPPRPESASPQLGDLMSYASDTWTSDYTWNGIRGNLDLNLGKQGFETLQEQSLHAWLETWKGEEDTYLLVSAGIDEEGTVELQDVIQVSSAAVPEEKALQMAAQKLQALQDESPWAVELVDDAGAVILSVPVEAAMLDDAEDPLHFIGTLVPMPDGVAGVRIAHEDDGVQASAARSTNAPEVTLNEPQSGAVMDEFLIVDWTATDPDEDDILQAMIQYSTDDGGNWTTLAVNAPNEPYVMDAQLLAGAAGTARVRVVVNDGFNSSEAVSAAFTVPPRVPEAAITRPDGGQLFALGEPILARGNAYDPEDGPLMGESLSWEIEGIGPAGFGDMVLLQDLPIGTHRLILTATDSDGETSTDEILLTVGPRPATQAEIAAVLAGFMTKRDGVDYDVGDDDVVDSADVHHAPR